MGYSKLADEGPLKGWEEQKTVGFDKESATGMKDSSDAAEHRDRHASEGDLQGWNEGGQSGMELKSAGDMKKNDRIAEWGGTPGMDQKNLGGDIVDTGNDNFRG